MMATPTKLLTAEEFGEHPSSRWAELIDGMIIEVSPPAEEHGRRQAVIVRVLGRAEDAGVGYVFGDFGSILRRGPDVVRAADVAFIRRERVPESGFSRAFSERVPDLMVEIVSPGDRPGEIQAKVREWIDAGARQVWVVYSDSNTVHVVRSMQDRATLGEDEILDGGDAVPGFSCRVSELFA
jgi:Uma2 family endonuclease